MSEILVGADPELFMKNRNSGEFVSAHARVPGTKLKPHKVAYGAIQVDGMALEFNIDPAHTVDEFVHNIKAVRKTLEEFVPGYNVVAEPVAMFEPDYFLWQVPASALELGCDPDFNGWTGDTNPHPDASGKPMRTASGHVHIGWTDDADCMDKSHFTLCCDIARQMDYALGIHSLLWDKDGTRRQMYGKAGAFRPKTYGMEYRVLSNRWLDSELLMRWVYNAIQIGVQDGLDGLWYDKEYGDVAQHIINDNIIDWRDQFNYIDLNLEPVPYQEVA